jgi:hypothetical protein
VATDKKARAKTDSKEKKVRGSKVDKAAKKTASERGKSLKRKKPTVKGKPVEKRPRCNPKKQGKLTGSEAGPQSEAEAVPATDPFEVAKQTVKGSVPAIVEAMVELAKQGSCTHAKTLLEMTGARHMFDSEMEPPDNGEPWAKLVLERLDEAEIEAAEESAKLTAEPTEVVTAP